jgi:hypothetical protein
MVNEKTRDDTVKRRPARGSMASAHPPVPCFTHPKRLTISPPPTDKERLVPASAEMMVELGRYRRARDLPALPSRHEDTPVALPLGNP